MQYDNFDSIYFDNVEIKKFVKLNLYEKYYFIRKYKYYDQR